MRVELIQTPNGLGIHDADAPRVAPLVLDFVGGRTAWRKKTGASRDDLVCRALGLGRGVATVVDATAGLGRDAVALAQAGFVVTAVERNATLAALWRDAFVRSGPIAGLHFLEGDAAALLQSLPAPDAVYLDPMYPAGPRSAQPKHEMLLVRGLVGEDPDLTALFARARATATQRVVVKRPKHAPPLAGSPDHQWVGASTRFDMYLRSSAREQRVRSVGGAGA